MRNAQVDNDASFFSYVHSIVKTMQSEGGQRLRRAQQAGGAIHRIALCEGDTIPDPSSFIEVPCHNVTSSSFSFFVTKIPNFDHLVIAFDLSGRTIYVESRVVSTCDVLIYESGEIRRLDNPAEMPIHAQDEPPALPVILVECEMIRRLEA